MAGAGLAEGRGGSHTLSMRMILFVVAALALAGAGYADAPAAAPNGTALAYDTYCSIKGMVSGNLGLMVGFGAAVFGLVQLIQGKTGAGLFLILGGALVTALPGMIEGTLSGLGSVLRTSGISETGDGAGSNNAYKPSGCGDRSGNGGGG